MDAHEMSVVGQVGGTVRRRPRRAGVTVVAALMAVAAVACTTTPSTPTEGAQLTASTSTEGVASGTVVTVEGTGFNPAGNLGTRPPLLGSPGGVYVVFACVTDGWQPSVGGGTRQVIQQHWALPAGSYETIAGLVGESELVHMAADGSFTADVTVTEGTCAGRYAIVTYAGSGAVNAGEEKEIPVSFSAAT